MEAPKINGCEVSFLKSSDCIQFSDYIIGIGLIDLHVSLGINYITMVDGVSIPVNQLLKVQTWIKEQKR